ncbi:MAG TPA: NAD(+)/NADH kinase [Nitrososphaeraceae archaeon]|jgi:NAD+ kinase|nr:NAD(+)/NADH kinase [Nitrososphaeraceae archaeon]
MIKKIEGVAIITKNLNKTAYEASEYITKILSSKNIKVSFIPPFETSNFKNNSSNFTSLVNEIDLIIALGGDGTTLRAFRFHPSDIPVFSINVGGTRGILSEIKLDLIDYALDAILNGNYYYDERIRIQASLSNKLFLPALNDILLFRNNLTRTPTITLKFRDGIITQRMDGIIVSTSTGSTGHSISLGGPVVHEELNCLVINPIASINKLPSIIIPPEEIEIYSNHKLDLIIDGQDKFLVEENSTIKITRFPINARFIRLRKKGFRQLEKLGF